MADIEKENLIDLVEKAQKGDKDAFGELYQIYYDELIRIALKHTSGRSEAAEDLVQDSMIKAMQNIRTLGNPLAFPGWIDRIVINRCKDYVTSYAVKNNSTFSEMVKATEDDDIEFDPEDKKTTSDPAKKLSQETRDKIVQDIITSLPDDQKAVTLLYYYDEMSIKEVAETLGLQQSTVIGRLQTAKKHIKSEVTSIQKKYDLKLYGIAPWPFFLYLLGKAKEEIKPFPVVDVSSKEANSKVNDNIHNMGEHEHKKKADSKASDTYSNQSDNSVSDVEKVHITGSKQVTGSSEIVSSSTSTIGAATAAKSVAGLNGIEKLIAAIGVVVGVSAGGYAIYKNNIENSNSLTQTSVVENNNLENDKGDETTDEESSGKENDIQLKQVEAIPNKLEISIPESWYIEQNINQNQYITKIHLSDNSYLEIRSDRPDGGAGGSYSVESASEKKYGNLTFWEIDSSDDEGHTGTMIFHSNSNSYGDDGSLKDGDWYDYIIQAYDVDMNDQTVQEAIASIKVKFDCKVKVIVEQLNIRNDFSTTATIYSTAKQGDTFEVYRTVLSSMPEATWYQILVDGQWKWLCGGTNDEYVEKIETKF